MKFPAAAWRHLPATVRGFTAGGMPGIVLRPAIIDLLASQPSRSEEPGIRPHGTSAAWNDSAGRVG